MESFSPFQPSLSRIRILCRNNCNLKHNLSIIIKIFERKILPSVLLFFSGVVEAMIHRALSPIGSIIALTHTELMLRHQNHNANNFSHLSGDIYCANIQPQPVIPFLIPSLCIQCLSCCDIHPQKQTPLNTKQLSNFGDDEQQRHAQSETNKFEDYYGNYFFMNQIR